jgi:vacuolar-type H+-ATPase subunit E/Vma4
MEVDLTPDQKAFIRQAIESGRLHREEQSIEEFAEEAKRRGLARLTAEAESEYSALISSYSQARSRSAREVMLTT